MNTIIKFKYLRILKSKDVKLLINLNVIKLTRKGIVLAGGKGLRLSPITRYISKQLIPIYDKPMIYYPLSTLMLMGIREILIITTKEDNDKFRKLLGDGNKLGISIEYIIQETPSGIADALILGQDFIKDSSVALILGDNIFHGDRLGERLKCLSIDEDYSVIFGYAVKFPKDYGVVEIDSKGSILNLEEKPESPKSRWAITGLYLYSNSAIKKVNNLSKSNREELEITDLNNLLLKDKKLKLEILGRGITWIDAGTFDRLLNASLYIKFIQDRQSTKICCPEEIAWKNNWITNDELKNLSINYKNTDYSKYLLQIIDDKFK